MQRSPAGEKAKPSPGLVTHVKTIRVTIPVVFCCPSHNTTPYREGKASCGQGEELSVLLRGWLGIKRILYGGYTLNL